jgi:hypothetical protein
MNRNIKNDVGAVPIPSPDRSRARPPSTHLRKSRLGQMRVNHKSRRQIAQLTSRFDCDAPLCSLRSLHFSHFFHLFISPPPFSFAYAPRRAFREDRVFNLCAYNDFIIRSARSSEVLATCNCARSNMSQHVISDMNMEIVKSQAAEHRSRRWCLRTF